MKNSHKIYLCGDSHANYVQKEFEKKDNIIDLHQTLGGYSVTSFLDKHSSRRPPQLFIDQFYNFFHKIEKQSIILFSSFDPEIRLGLLEKRFSKNEDFSKEMSLLIKKTVDEIKKISNFKHLIILDLYPVSLQCGVLNISKEFRIKARDIIQEIFINLNYKDVSFLTCNRDGLTHSKETGFIIDEGMTVGDKAHFNIEFCNEQVKIGDLIRTKILEEIDKKTEKKDNT